MPPQDTEFLNANMQDKVAYLSSVDPEFKKAPPHEQTAYIQHLTGQMQTAPGETAVEKAAPPKNYGFTSGNMLHGLGEGVKGIFTGGYALGKDIATNPNWVIGPDSTYRKFIDAPAEGEAVKARDLWNKGGVSNRVQSAGHALAGAVPMVGPWAAHLGERAGTGDVGGAASEAVGAVGTGYALPKVRGALRDSIYTDMPPSGKGPQLNPAAKQLSRVAGGAAGVGIAPDMKYEAAIGGALLGPEVLKKVAGRPELGSIKNPGPYSKMPLRSRVPESGTETPVPQLLSPLGSSQPRGRMGPPLRPNVFASPEDAQIYDAQMSRLGAEAKDAGMYSAARGAVKRIPDYQERIGSKLRPFGPPEDLMEESDTPPVRRKVENE